MSFTTADSSQDPSGVAMGPRLLLPLLCVRVYVVASVVSDSVTPWTVARQAPLSLEFSRQQCWNGLPFSPSGEIPDPGIEPMSLVPPTLTGRFFITTLASQVAQWIKKSPATLASQVAQWIKKSPAMQETQKTRVGYLVEEDPLEEEIATHSSILAWRIPWIEEPGRLHSIGSQRARHD